MWEKTDLFLSYKTPDFFIITTTKFILDSSTFAEVSSISQVKGHAIPYISTEKNYCLHKLLEVIDIKDKKILLCEQIHGNKIVFVNKVKKLKTIKVSSEKSYKYQIFPRADGIITSEKEYVVVVFTADCVPLFVYSTDASVFGLIHAGRKGLENNIIDNLMKILIHKQINTKKLRFLLGPHICEKCYTVGGENYSLSKVLTRQLLLAGISEEQITCSQFCTYHSNTLFFSYRRDRTPYRLLSLITPK